MPSSRSGPPPPVTLVLGSEELLVDRAIAAVVRAARRADDETEVHDVEAGALEPGGLTEYTSPSLFGGAKVVVVRGADALGKALMTEVTDLVADVPDDVYVVVHHAGGKRGKALLDAARAVGAQEADCAPVKRFGDRLDFVVAEVRRQGGTIGQDGARALLDAVGTDLRELATACAQLVADTTGPEAGARIGPATVARYYRGRAEVTSFTVADKAVEGRAADALEQLRWALAVGVAPVLVSSALAQGVRQVAFVRAAEGMRPAEMAQQLGMPPWKVDRVRKQVRGWTDAAVAHALQTIATADADIKGEAADATYALERAVVTVARCARG